MFDDVRRHMIYQLANAPLFNFPFTHVVVDGILPDSFYDTLRAMLPEGEEGEPDGQPGRRALHPDGVAGSGLDDTRKAFWASMFATMMHDDVGAWIMAKFYDRVSARFGLDQPGGGVALRSSTRLVRDGAGFAPPPHNDPPTRVISALIYLPAPDARPELGTAFYLPRDGAPEFPDGVDQDPALFERAATIPFRPNTLLAFPRTPASFHGVEATPGPGERRDLLLFDLDVPG
jgi:hypothetical protein